TLTPNLTAFTGVDSQNLPDVMVSVQFILAIGARKLIEHFIKPADLLLTLFCWARRSRAMCVIIIVVTIRTLKRAVKKEGACHVSPPGRF
ncbi:hypothetical protein, partial [Lactobacillus delbrueckii]|uniref:hypothetical protein n=1 Tax=Lactobacillus delbrueckii TaxID=1584 RepID=UPI0021A5B47E